MLYLLILASVLHFVDMASTYYLLTHVSGLEESIWWTGTLIEKLGVSGGVILGFIVFTALIWSAYLLIKRLGPGVVKNIMSLALAAVVCVKIYDSILAIINNMSIWSR